MRRRAWWSTALLLATCLPAAALAQSDTWPTRPIHLLIGYPPGGSTDVAGRLLADALGRKLGQTVIVDNRAGASGTIATQAVVRAEPDGYTLLLAASPEISIAPIAMKALPYDPVKDLQPVTLVGRVPFFLVVNPALPATTLREFVTYAKANPDKLAYSSFGRNTSNHLAGELFKSMSGIEALHVPYKGSAPSVTDLIGGQVQFTFDTPPAVLAYVKTGKLRALAIASNERLASAADVPTFAEAGVPGFVAGTWFGLMAPARTPRAIVDKLNAAAASLLATPELSKAFSDRGMIAAGDSPDEFGAFIRAEVGKWKALAGKLGIVAE